MAIRHTLIIAPLLLALTACETAQENPNYKYSSTYKETAPHLAQNSRHPDQVQSPAPVRYVNTTPVQQGTQTIQTSTIHTSSSTNGIGCQPVSVTAAHQQPIIAQAHTPSHQAQPLLLATHQNEPVNNVFASANAQDYAPSLTENTYSADSIGTPGYEAVRQSQSLSADNSYASQTIAPVISQAPSNSTAFASAPLTSNSGASHSGGFTGQPLVNTAPPIVPVVTPQNIPAWPRYRLFTLAQHMF